MSLKDPLEGILVKLAAAVIVGLIGIGAITIAGPLGAVTIPVGLVLVVGYYAMKD